MQDSSVRFHFALMTQERFIFVAEILVPIKIITALPYTSSFLKGQISSLSPFHIKSYIVVYIAIITCTFLFTGVAYLVSLPQDLSSRVK